MPSALSPSNQEEGKAKLQRRQEAHQLDKQIWDLKVEIQGLKLAVDLLILGRFTEIEDEDDLKGMDLAIRLLKAERSKRAAEIKRLQEQKKELKA